MTGLAGLTGTTPAEAIPPPSDDAAPEELIRAVALHQHRAAFARLFKSYGPRLKGFLAARGTDLATAEELAQETMLAVWRKAHQFDPARGSASTWIYTIARNTLCTHLRGQLRAELDPEDPALVAPAPVPEDELAVLCDRDALVAAMSALPGEQVDALRGAYFQGRSLAEVAEGQRVPLGTVKTRVRLALERLRRLLGAGEVR